MFRSVNLNRGATIQNRRVIILAAKDISQNRRVPLLAKYFADKGARVDVFAFTPAHSHYADERITFHAVPVRFFAAQFLQWLETSQGKPVNSWRPRLGNRAALGYLIGLAEVLKYRLRRVIARGVIMIWGRGIPKAEKRALISEGRYAHILRERFGSKHSDRRRQTFERNAEATLRKDLPPDALIVCHDRYTAALALSLARNGHDVIFDVVELFRARSTKSLETLSAVQRREIESAEALLPLSIPISVSEGMAQELGHSGPMQAIYNGRERSQWTEGAAGEDAPKQIVFSGAFFEGCGLLRLVKMMAHMPPDVSLRLVGYFSAQAYQMKVMDAIVELGLSERVQIVGGVDVQALPQSLVGAAVYIIPFSPENANLKVSMPNRLFDAIAAGLPVLAYKDLQLTDWLISNGAGAALDSLEPEPMAEQVLAFMNSTQYANRQSSVKRAFDQSAYESQMQILDRYLTEQGLYPS